MEEEEEVARVGPGECSVYLPPPPPLLLHTSTLLTSGIGSLSLWVSSSSSPTSSPSSTSSPSPSSGTSPPPSTTSGPSSTRSSPEKGSFEVEGEER